MEILIVTPRAAYWEALLPAFERKGGKVRFAAGMEEALDSLRASKAQFALLDIFGGEAWSDDKAAALRNAVISILMVDAMTNMASACGMGDEVFHDAMEGLGMINDLPAAPVAEDVESLMDALKVILGI